MDASEKNEYAANNGDDDPGFDIGMTDDEKRHDELTRAPKSDESDAAPRITTTTSESGATRIDIADTAAVRPGIDPQDK